MLPLELAILLQKANIVVDNARRPVISATESATPTLPVLCRYGPPKILSASSRRRLPAESKRSVRASSCSRWASEPSAMLKATHVPTSESTQSTTCATSPLRTQVRYCGVTDQSPRKPPRRESLTAPSLKAAPHLTILLDEALALSEQFCVGSRSA